KGRVEYFYIKARYLDFNGKVFGEALSEHAIKKFRRAKQITALDIFPLSYYPGKKSVRAHLIECSRKFLSIMNIRLGEYKGKAFYIEKERVVEIFIKSRVVVDAAYFREKNPNYTRPSIKESDEDSGWIIINLDEASDKSSSLAKANGIDPSEVKRDDLLICSPTKQAALDDLHIPLKKKKAVQALFEAHDKRATTNSFDNVVEGKKQGFSVFLHGPLSVSKTLTAELLAEHFRRALMPVSAGELGTTAEAVEKRLLRIFKRASRWKAVLLLDEADVLLEQRSVQDIYRNALVCVFLRTLEYYPGMMFLTTNRVRQIDDAIASKIYFKLKYNNLNLDQRTSIWRGFLRKAVTSQGEPIYSRNAFKSLVSKKRNGREIKNLVTMSYLEVAITVCKDFECDFKGAGSTEALNSYF
ncbi:P-loop containing nucleoside triphosphate hydrolase protein, partial [Bisporella sp. PMI_857]